MKTMANATKKIYKFINKRKSDGKCVDVVISGLKVMACGLTLSLKKRKRCGKPKNG